MVDAQAIEACWCGRRSPVGFCHWIDLPLEVASGDRIIGLHRIEFRPAEMRGNSQRLGDPPGRPIGAADIANQALRHEIVERAERFLLRCKIRFYWVRK